MRIKDNTDAAAQAADDYISEHGTQSLPTIEIFGSNTCTYCEQAKQLCVKYGLKYKYFNIDEDTDAFDHLVSRIKQWRTVPQIFWGPDYIGGYTDLAKRIGVIPSSTINPRN